MALLVDWQIRELVEKGEIVISPFNEAQLNTVSYDVCLGLWAIRERKGVPRLLNPRSEDSIAGRWQKPEYPKSAKDLLDPEVLEREGFDPNEQIILIEPGELILGHTIESVGGVSHVTTAMHARSTLGRMGISVCKCAGWGDVGYFSIWTMEIENHSARSPIALPVGARVAQISFELVEEPTGRYTKAGHYQIHTNVEKAISNWHPEKHMLPKPI